MIRKNFLPNPGRLRFSAQSFLQSVKRTQDYTCEAKHKRPQTSRYANGRAIILNVRHDLRLRIRLRYGVTGHFQLLSGCLLQAALPLEALEVLDDALRHVRGDLRRLLRHTLDPLVVQGLRCGECVLEALRKLQARQQLSGTPTSPLPEKRFGSQAFPSRRPSPDFSIGRSFPTR